MQKVVLAKSGPPDYFWQPKVVPVSQFFSSPSLFHPPDEIT